MPTGITHAVVGLGLAELFAPGPMPLPFYGLSMALSVLPDIDVLAFNFGIPYGARSGHRGFSHSLFCALLAGLVAALATFAVFAVPWWLLWGFFFVVTASHGVLDAMTNGGMGIALLAPFDPTRYFLPWRPVQVSPLGLGFFSRWGLRALASELTWIWLPLAVLVVAVKLLPGS